MLEYGSNSSKMDRCWDRVVGNHSRVPKKIVRGESVGS